MMNARWWVMGDGRWVMDDNDVDYADDVDDDDEEDEDTDSDDDG